MTARSVGLELCCYWRNMMCEARGSEDAVIARGCVRNGVIVLEAGVRLPEGTMVTVSPETTPASRDGGGDRMSEAERRRIVEIMDRIAALPDESPGHTFSGADHDKILYGKP